MCKKEGNVQEGKTCARKSQHVSEIELWRHEQARNQNYLHLPTPTK